MICDVRLTMRVWDYFGFIDNLWLRSQNAKFRRKLETMAGLSLIITRFARSPPLPPPIQNPLLAIHNNCFFHITSTSKHIFFKRVVKCEWINYLLILLWMNELFWYWNGNKVRQIPNLNCKFKILLNIFRNVDFVVSQMSMLSLSK